jgi:glutamate synthase domain-containing protein 3
VCGPASDPAGPTPPVVTLNVPEIRDYEVINKELRRLLDEGAPRIVLAGVEGQRLLGFGLSGNWPATIVIDGRAGPELAARLDASNLTIICRGDAADGAAGGLRAGRIVIEGDAGDGLGYAQAGGTILVKGNAGHRAGLMQAGGSLIVLGDVGRLAGDRQGGGLLVAHRGRVGPHAGKGRVGGQLIEVSTHGPHDRAEIEALAIIRGECGEWLSPDAFPIV